MVTFSMSDNDVGERRQDEGAANTISAHFPGGFALAGSGIDAEHERKDVKGGGDVENLEDEVPCRTAGGDEEEVDIAGAEDGGIEGLCNERDTWIIVRLCEA
jgi:hypothetical protein